MTIATICKRIGVIIAICGLSACMPINGIKSGGNSSNNSPSSSPQTATQTVLSTQTSTSTSSSNSGSLTSLHYASGCADCGDGFNLADVSSVSELNSLPSGDKGLVWLGLCNGADSNFTSTVLAYRGNSNLYGFYVMDEPDSTGQYAPLCTAANLKAESDYIHANLPGAKTFIVMMNMGGDTTPNYVGSFNPANTDIDLFGLDPYPCKTEFNGCDYGVINSSVAAANTAGIPTSQIVPVYQAFGGGGYSDWLVPTAAEAQEDLDTWAPLVPSPAFDYVYAWGQQESDQSLSGLPSLQAVFSAHNSGSSATSTATSTASSTASSSVTATQTSTSSSTATATAANQDATYSYINANIIQRSCVSCHSGFSTYTGLLNIVTPGSPPSSPMYINVANGTMPKNGPPLSSQQIQDIQAWITAGAPND